MPETVEQLKESIRELTKLCCALHKRLGGGTVVLPAREYGMFDGSEDLSVDNAPGGKGFVVTVAKKS